MTKKQLEDRIVALEARVADLEARPIATPWTYTWPQLDQTWKPPVYPTITYRVGTVGAGRQV